MRKLKFPALAAAAVLGAATAIAGAAPVKDVHRTLALAADGRLEISAYKGTIEVSTWDRPEADISARVEADTSGGDSDATLARKVEETRVEIDGGGGSVRVKSDYSRVRDGHFLGLFGSQGTVPFVHYKIRMPATARLAVDDYKSDTRVAGLKADLKLHTYKGTVRVEGLDGAADVDTYKGDVRVAFARYSRSSRFETYKGEMEVSLPRDSRFALEAEAGRRGSLDSDFGSVERVGWRSREERARSDVNGGGPALRIETSRGTIRLRRA